MKIAIPFLSLDRIISLSKIYLSFASLSTSFVRREILLVFEMWSQIVWMTMMMLGIFRNNRNTSLISMNKLQKLISSLTSSCFHHFILCCNLSKKKKKQNGWKLHDYKNNKKKKNWHGTHSHCTSIFSKIPFIIIFQTTASQFEKANFTHPPTPFLFFPPPPPLFSSVARRGQKASDEQNAGERVCKKDREREREREKKHVEIIERVSSSLFRNERVKRWYVVDALFLCLQVK